MKSDISKYSMFIGINRKHRPHVDLTQNCPSVMIQIYLGNESMMRLSNYLDRLINVFAVIAGLLTIVLMLGVFLDVCLRFLFNKPTGWVVEYAEYSLLFITFLAAPWVLKENRHVFLDMLLERLSRKNRYLVNSITSLAAGIVFLVFTWYACSSTYHYFEINYRMATSLRTLKWPIMCVIPAGSLLVSLQFFRHSVHHIRSFISK